MKEHGEKNITSYFKNFSLMMSKSFVAVMLMLAMASLTACSQQKVVFPVDVVKQEDNTKEQEENAQEDTPESDDTIVEEKPEDLDEETEEFKLLEDDDTETEPDDKGHVITQDGKPVIDLIFFMGQSNMSGAGGDASLAPPVEEETGYEFRAISDPTMLYPITEPFGKNESFIGGLCDLPGAKKGSIVSAFANEYYVQTGVPIVGVSISQGATTTEHWLSLPFACDVQQRYDRAVEWLDSNGYYIRNRYVIWFQGESDAANHVPPEIYNTNMDNIIRPLFISGVNKVFIITPGRTLSIKNYFDDIISKQLTMCKESGYYALGTNILSDVSAAYMVDEWHYNQLVLNIIGIETAKSVAYYTLNRKERIDYNYKEDCTYIPDGFEYTGDETVEPLNLSDLQRLQDEYWEDYLRRKNGEYE